ncbi:ornithine cyclodeaminase, partial [Burkholderia cenocepacia]|nr:ornithine cyclodeaminase [Burkholderia cenocepacia]
AAQALARPDSRTMALIGNGAQSEFQAIAFHTLLGIDEIRVFDVDPRARPAISGTRRDFARACRLRAASTA